MNKKKYPDYVPDYEKEEMEKTQKKGEKERIAARREILRQNKNTADIAETKSKVTHVDSSGKSIVNVRLEGTSTVRSRFKIHSDRKKEKPM